MARYDHAAFNLEALVGLTAPSQPRVHILMAVYQGEAYLAQQLASLSTQTHTNWRLWAGMDCTPNGQDQSRNILRASAQSPTFVEGPRNGAAANFISLMGAAPAGDIWALCDQDDVWLPHKLARAVSKLNAFASDVPTLYCARTLIADQHLCHARLSKRRCRAPSFENALVQNIASGNTIVLNGAATQLVSDIIKKVDMPLIHDWWLYQLITGVGGRIIFDDAPVLLYRQHPQNVIGANDSWGARMARIHLIFRGIWAGWTDRNIATLQSIEGHLSPRNRQKLALFARARRAPLLRRLWGLRRSGIYRQGHPASIVMWLAAALGRL